jgi:hypothetical protein
VFFRKCSQKTVPLLDCLSTAENRVDHQSRHYVSSCFAGESAAYHCSLDVLLLPLRRTDLPYSIASSIASTSSIASFSFGYFMLWPETKRLLFVRRSLCPFPMPDPIHPGPLRRSMRCILLLLLLVFESGGR